MMYDSLNYNLLDCFFPQLEHLELEFSTDQTERVGEKIEGMLRRNPQVRTVQIANFPDDYVKVISDLLPNLESLVIDDHFRINETVHFENVKHFAIRSKWPDTIERMSFARLESMNMEYSSNNGIMPPPVDILQKWLKFFRNHQSLSKLFLFAERRMPDDHLLALIDSLPNLVELRIQIIGYMNPETINEIIRSHGQLRTFVWYSENNEVSDITMLQENFENDWHIRRVENKKFWIERKNSTL